MRSPLARRAPAEPPPEPTLEEAVEAACVAADEACSALAAALQRRAEALRALQRTHRHPAPALLGKALGHDAVEQALAAAGVAAFTSIFVSPKARRTFADQARGLGARHPTQQEG